jgi:hypothetical protein
MGRKAAGIHNPLIDRKLHRLTPKTAGRLQPGGEGAHFGVPRNSVRIILPAVWVWQLIQRVRFQTAGRGAWLRS